MVKYEYEKMLKSLIIREIQIKTTWILSHIYSDAVIKKMKDNECWQGFSEKGILIYHWLE
jgi:hypothetical protein